MSSKLHNKITHEKIVDDIKKHYIKNSERCSACRKHKHTHLVTADVETKNGIKRKFLALCDDCIKKYS